MLVLPVLAAMLVLASYLSQSFKARNDLVIGVRTAGMSRALNGVCVSPSQIGSYVGDLMSGRFISCGLTSEERQLPDQDRFWNRAERTTAGFRSLVPSLPPPGVVQARTSRGIARIAGLEAPTMPATFADFSFAVAASDVWAADEAKAWKDGYDPVLYRELRSRGSYRLFPNVFPAALR